MSDTKLERDLQWLEERYRFLCHAKTDISDVLPILLRYATGCQRITEFGVRAAVSTTALLLAQPAHLDCYDIAGCGVEALELARHSGKTNMGFYPVDTLEAAPAEPTDLLFIDTLHTRRQLERELVIHGGSARRYLMFHDTFTYGKRNEVDDGDRREVLGLLPAIGEFMEKNQRWQVAEQVQTGNGLLVLAKI